jgi:cytidylate kinase
MGEDVRVVTVSGPPGSGTSTVCQLLAERLGWRHLNAGQVFRDLAAETGVSLAEYGARAEADPRIDRALDARMVERARQGEPAILEGRLTGWMAARHGVPALKVWLDAAAHVRASRVGQRDGGSAEAAAASMSARERSERLRYARFHGIDLADRAVYDLVLDSGGQTPEELVERILEALARPRKGG